MRTCKENWHAELVSADGLVELGTTQGWQPVSSGATLCAGDTLRTGRYSRASVRIEQEGTLVQIHPDSIIRIHALENESHSWYDTIVKVLKGALHAVSRDPRSLNLQTPFANAGIEGTELVLAVDDEGTTLTVIEGEVLLANSAGMKHVAGGARSFAGPGLEPQASAAVDALQSIEWTRHFPRILSGAPIEPWSAPNEEETGSAAFYSSRAASRLAAGSVADAQADLAAALALDARDDEALSLSALIALSEGDEAGALAFARSAIDANAESASGWLAQALALDAADDRSRAQASAEQATSIAPEHAYAWALLAELYFAAGRYRAARATMERASELGPDLPYVDTIRGFAELEDGHSEAAEASFRKSIRLNSTDARAHLGLGLSLLRQGSHENARRHAEIALALDPTNAVIRGYLGNIYDAENREKLSGTQLQIARALDESDSAVWFYEARRKQHQNRLGEAVLDYRRSYDRNGRRSVYGRGLSLDEDLPSRSAGIGRLHSVLGVEQLALLTGWSATFHEPSEYSGHRLLADVYAHRPRHQIARVNELHQAILNQPLNVTPVQPQLTEANPFALDVLGPSALSHLEFHSPIRENGPSYQLSGVTAGNGTRGLDLTLNGLHDRVSYNLGVLQFETNGFRPNNDFDQRILDAMVQIRPNAATTITTELRSSDIEKGDSPLRFDPSDFFPSLREAESVDSARLGVRHRTDDATWTGTVIVEKAAGQFHGIGPVSQSGERRGNAVDLQQVRKVGAWQIIAGLRHLDQNQHDELVTPVPAAPSPLGMSTNRHDVAHKSAYAYANVELGSSLRATVGGNLEAVESNNVERRRFGPKLGVMWDISGSTTLRAAVIRNLQAPLISKHNILPTLEPTHVAGFNQQYFGVEGEEAWRYGVAVDHRFAERLFGGIELSRRDVEMRFFALDSDTFDRFEELVRRDERSHLMYLYFLVTPSVTFASSYQYDEIDGGEKVLPDGFSRVRTQRIPLQLTFTHASGLSAGIETTFVDQVGYFSSMFDGDAPERGADRFWTANLSLGYRLPSKRGQISLNVHNALDQEFRFQDVDPENPRLFPGRLAQLTFTLSY